MSKPRRRKQKKQVKPELKLRQFAATELSDQLAAQHSAADLPRFLVDTVAGAYAPADAELMIEGFGAAATRPVTLRANTLKATAEDIAAALGAAGIAHNPVAWYPAAFILPEAQGSDLWDLDIYRDGKIYLQSLSSMMPPLVLGAQAGEDILDPDNNNSNKDNGTGDHKNDQNTTDRGDSALTGGDTTVEDAVTKQNSRPGVSYGQMLRNARVHDSDGLLTDHENAASGRTA